MAFGELQCVTIGIFDEGNFILTAGPVGLRFKSKFHTC